MLNKTLDYGNTTIQNYRNQTTEAIQTLTTDDVDVIIEEESTSEL
jgi:hypothetical protein